MAEEATAVAAAAPAKLPQTNARARTAKREGTLPNEEPKTKGASRNTYILILYGVFLSFYTTIWT
jgi:hypothetical protein